MMMTESIFWQQPRTEHSLGIEKINYPYTAWTVCKDSNS